MRKLSPRGTMVAACLSFVCHGAISAALGPALPGLSAHTGSSLVIAVGALAMLALFGSYHAVSRRALVRVVAG
jgi:hypothetical protein